MSAAIPTVMYDDTAGVAGFFEDIPVLALVLVGVSTLVASGVHLYALETDERLVQTLHREARELMCRIIREAGAPSPDMLPFAAALEPTNLSRYAAELPDGLGYSVSVVRLHPNPEWLFSIRSSSISQAACTGFASSRLNAIMSDGLVGVFEVRVIVWQGPA